MLATCNAACKGAVLAAALVIATGAAAAGAKRNIAYLKFSPPFWQVWVMQEDGSATRQLTTSPGDKLRVSWFPDGKRVLVNSIQGRVYEVDLDGHERRIPIELEGMTDAQVSPDGDWIAFSVSSANVVDNNDIWRVRPDGSGLQRLVALNGLQHFPTWSPDGREIVFLSGEGKNDHDIHRVEIATRESAAVISGRLYNFDPAVAADGRIAFSSNREGDYDIWIIDRDGGNARNIAASPGLDSQPAWSPDGKWLLFTSARQDETGLWKVRHNGRKLQRLTPPDESCKGGAWSP